MSGWMQNDGLFRSEIAAGHKWERKVCDYLNYKGFPAKLNAQQVRPDVSQREEYTDSGDITCYGHVIEVKSRRVRFTCVNDLPYDQMIVEAVYRWNNKEPKPSAVICVSQLTRGMVAIGPSEIARWAQWESVKMYDRIKRGRYDYYVLPRNRWHDIERLLIWLQAQEAQR